MPAASVNAPQFFCNLSVQAPLSRPQGRFQRPGNTLQHATALCAQNQHRGGNLCEKPYAENPLRDKSV